MAAVNDQIASSASCRAAFAASHRSFAAAERLIGMRAPRKRVLIGGHALQTVPPEPLKAIQEQQVYGSAGLGHPRHFSLHFHGPGLQLTMRRQEARAGVSASASASVSVSVSASASVSFVMFRVPFVHSAVCLCTHIIDIRSCTHCS